MNIFFDRVVQQLKKYESSLIYTVIHEMWVDARVRDMTDIFIRCEDTALSPDGLNGKKKVGQDFKWIIFPMTRYLTGQSYYVTHRPFDTCFLKFTPWRGIYDDKLLQARGSTKYGFDFKQMGGDTDLSSGVEFQSSQKVIEARQKWGWLEDAIRQLHDQGVEAIIDNTLWDYLGVKDRGLSTKEIGKQLSAMGVIKHQVAGRRYEYIIDNYNLDSLSKKKEASLIKY